MSGTAGHQLIQARETLRRMDWEALLSPSINQSKLSEFNFVFFYQNEFVMQVMARKECLPGVSSYYYSNFELMIFVLFVLLYSLYSAWRSPETESALLCHVCSVLGAGCDWDLSVTIDLADLSRLAGSPRTAGLFSPVFTP